MEHEVRDTQSQGVSRRGFLTGIGAGAAGAAGAVVLPSEAVAQQQPVASRPDRFTRIFELRPFAEATPRVQQALRDMGAPGGILDAKDPLAEGPVRLITNPELSPGNLDNPASTAGVTFFGQFLDHDMTFDTTSRLGVPTRPERSPNTRTPTLDLDSVYGGGPTASPQLYEASDRSKFRVGHGGLFEDLPRDPNNRAVIPDPRNDENLMIAGLQVAFLKAHNRVVDILRDDSAAGSLTAAAPQTEADEADAVEAFADASDIDRNVYADARRLVTWHYQWIIVHDFLPAIIGASLVNDILSRGRRFYRPRPGEQSMPVEFQGAAYRFGHSMVRPS